VFLQLPLRLVEALQEDARANERTITGQFIWVLKQHYPKAVEPVAATTATTKAKKK
jgi:hypothetical protein